MAKILLDYVFPVSVISPTPQASTAFLKQVCVVAKPKSGQSGNVGNLYECTSMSEVAARTDNTNAQQLFNAGMAKVFILLANNLELETPLNAHGQEFFTMLVSDDFDDDDIVTAFAVGTATVSSYANLVSGTADDFTVAGVTFTAQAGAATLGTATFQAATSNDLSAASLAAQINAHADTKDLVEAVAVAAVVTITAKVAGASGNAIALDYNDNGSSTVGGSVSGAFLAGGGGIILGVYDGVIGVSSTDSEVIADQAVIENRAGFKSGGGNGAKNMFFAFGKLLSNAVGWRNLQYITMPFNDAVTSLGVALGLFEDRVSFVINDDQYGSKLAMFAAGGKAIVCPYIVKNLRVDLQSASLSWISGNQPQYTLKEASLLETRLQEDVINSYIAQKEIVSGSILITLVNENFVATGSIRVAEPKALWRSENELIQTA